MGYGYRWERSRLVTEFSVGRSCCCQCVSRHASQVEGKIHDRRTIELFESYNCGGMQYSGSMR